MDMNCALTDDLCNLQRDYANYVAGIVRDQKSAGSTFLLGAFNGRVYTYGEVGGYTLITIQRIEPDKIGKFELPDTIPPDFLED